MAYTTINDPEKYFKPVVYTGNLLQHPVEGLNHQSDWLWIKNMDTTNSHNVLDSIINFPFLIKLIFEFSEITNLYSSYFFPI